MIQLLLSHGANPSNGHPLHFAAEGDQREALTLLINKGAKLDSKGLREQTALYLAVSTGHPESARILLEAGADPSGRDGSRGESVLHHAANRGYAELATLILDRGVDVNVRDKSGRTPLHEAAERGHRKVVALLLARGADVNSKAADGWTPLHGAVFGGPRFSKLEFSAMPIIPKPPPAEDTKAVVELLLAAHADPRAKTSDRMTPRYLAAERGLSDLVELLRAAEGDEPVSEAPGSERPDDLSREARAARMGRDYERAEEFLVKWTRVEPDSVDAWLQLGISRRLLGNTAGARASYEHALELCTRKYEARPYDIVGLFQQTSALALLGRQSEARNLIESVIAQRPGDKEVGQYARDFDRMCEEGRSFAAPAE